MVKNNYYKGHLAELVAAAALMLKGYIILKRRYKTPGGEIDLIAKRGNIIVAVEVKARPSIQQGLEAISTKQQRRICNAMRSYRRRRRWKTALTRYDAIIVRPYAWPRHLIDVWRETY